MTDEKLKEIEARYNSFPDPIGQGPTQSQARILFNQQLEKDIPALIKAIRDLKGTGK